MTDESKTADVDTLQLSWEELFVARERQAEERQLSARLQPNSYVTDAMTALGLLPGIDWLAVDYHLIALSPEDERAISALVAVNQRADVSEGRSTFSLDFAKMMYLRPNNLGPRPKSFNITATNPIKYK